MTLKAGLHEGLTFEEYDSLDAVSCSDLVKLSRSPAHLKCAKEEEDDDKEPGSTILGRAIHAAFLEPELFARSYEPVEKKTRKKAGELELVTERIELKKKEYERALEVAEALRNHKSISSLTYKSSNELTAVWQDRDTGLWCKGRYDIFVPKTSVIADLKTTTDARMHKFAQQVFQYRYYLKAEWYLQGARALGVEEPEFVFIAVEKSPPFAAALYTLKTDVYDLAKLELEELLKKYRYCKQSGQWPAYPDHIEMLGLPEWGKKVIAGSLTSQQQQEDY